MRTRHYPLAINHLPLTTFHSPIPTRHSPFEKLPESGIVRKLIVNSFEQRSRSCCTNHFFIFKMIDYAKRTIPGEIGKC